MELMKILHTAIVIYITNCQSIIKAFNSNETEVQVVYNSRKPSEFFAYPTGMTYEDYLKSLIAIMKEGKRIINTFEKDKEEENRYNASLNINNNDSVLSRENFQYNITSCEEFGKKYNFHPKYLFYEKWVSFYTWPEREDNVYQHNEIFSFEIPTTKVNIINSIKYYDIQ